MRLNVKTHLSKTYSMVQKNTKPPKDQGGWMAVTKDILESSSYPSLRANAHKALDRLRVEHISYMRPENGNLIVLHEQFYDYGVTAEYVADALDELAFKGLIKRRTGRAGNGTAHPTIFTLTFDGTRDGLPTTDDWKKLQKNWPNIGPRLNASARWKSALLWAEKENPRYGIPKCVRLREKLR